MSGIINQVGARSGIISGGGSASAGTVTLSGTTGLDYEEGTWTPVFERTTGGAISATYNRIGNTYTRIGRLVTVNCYTVISNVTDSGSSLNRVTGLPFNVSSVDYQGVGSVQFNSAFTSDVAKSVTAYYNDIVVFGPPLQIYGSIGVAWMAGALSFTLTYTLD